MHSQGHGIIDSRYDAVSVREMTMPVMPRPLRRVFRGEPSQVPLVRDFVRRYLAGWPCPTDALQDTLLCVTELAANAVRHSRSGLPGGHFGVKIAICDPTCIGVAVEDAGGSWQHERGDETEGGRGLQIVSALSAEMGVRGGHSGRIVWFLCPCN